MNGGPRHKVGDKKSFHHLTTNEITIFELFRGLHYSFRGVFELNFHYSYSFLILLTRIQLQEIIPLSDFQSFLQLQLHKLMVFEFKM